METTVLEENEVLERSVGTMVAMENLSPFRVQAFQDWNGKHWNDVF